MAIRYGWQLEQEQASQEQAPDPPIVRAADKHLSDGKPGVALLGLAVMVGGTMLIWSGVLSGIVVVVVGAATTLAGMPKTIRRLGFILGIIAAAVIVFAAM